MKDLKFRLLNADEIDCRVGTTAKDGSWCTLLLYKDARVDMRLLDEVVGAYNWQRKHELIDGQLFCTISIWDEDKKMWIGKQDVGTESNTEAEKGRSSDSFKRACFNLGIGRELYTAPTIFIKTMDGDTNSFGKISQSFSVKSIGYTEGAITSLVIVDKRGNVRFSMGDAAPKETRQNNERVIDGLIAMVSSCKSMDDLMNLRNQNMQFANDERFRNALNERAKQVKMNAA